MPAVGGMKRTRVFGLVKGGDVARVLRSGRCLYLESSDGKVKNHVSVKGKENGWSQNGKLKKQDTGNAKIVAPKKVGSDEKDGVGEVKRYGIVYVRKRKRQDVKDESKVYGTRSSLRLRSHSKKEGSSEVVSESKGDQAVASVAVETEDLMEVKETLVSEVDSNGGKMVVCCLSATGGRGPKLVSRNIQYRSGLNYRGIRKRRSSLVRRKASNPILFRMHSKSDNDDGFVSNPVNEQKDSLLLSLPVTGNDVSSSMQSGSVETPKSAMSNVVVEEQSADSSSCSANLLVIESDRCYRIADATVELEMFGSGEWVIAVKKDWSTRCTHVVQKVMRPCSSNRITHDLMWTADENWKLEFPNKRDWFIFKDLYKECLNRNLPSSTTKAIPVPGVREVSECEDQSSAPFTRPDEYIKMEKDEVARAMTKKTANYDMDSEDEEWLKKFNNESFRENEQHDPLSEDNFELMVDVFEKSIYYTPDDFTDNKAAADLCLELGKREAVEALYDYWMEKRKRRKSPLLRIFQGHRVKKSQIIPKPSLRKKRSFKRQPSQIAREKPPVFLQSEAKKYPQEDHYALRRVEEAKLSMKISVDTAILKRRRAQLLMENADLLAYKAAMALKIAEAVLVAESSGIAVDHLLD